MKQHLIKIIIFTYNLLLRLYKKPITDSCYIEQINIKDNELLYIYPFLLSDDEIVIPYDLDDIKLSSIKELRKDLFNEIKKVLGDELKSMELVTGQ